MTETKVLPADLKELTAEIVAAYVAHNRVPPTDLPHLIASVYGAIIDLALPSPCAQAPAVRRARSVQPDHIVCLEDGRKFTSLKQHLATSHGMTPEEYRVKWDLPAHYPMVSPNHSAKRSRIAKRMGLGGRR